MQAIGICPGIRLGYIDHIVPLCHLMNIPILCTDPWIQHAIEFFYPSMEVLLDEGEEFSLHRTLDAYDTFFYVDTHRKPQGTFQFVEYIYEKKARSVCGLHGNSDKKRNIFWAEKYADEDVFLLYGPYMRDFLYEKGLQNRLGPYVFTGNFRYEFYLENQSFFDRKVESFLFPNQKRKTLFYAPTWTSENKKTEWRFDYSSFFHVYPYVLDHIPSDVQVLVKLHPHMALMFPEEVERIKNRYSESDQVIFLNDIPLIYPLLAQADWYLGDYSSVGYDFLSFNKPLFFFNESNRNPDHDNGVFLYRTGTMIHPSDYHHLYSIICNTDLEAQKEARTSIYAYAFGAKKSLDTVAQEIKQALA